MKDRAVCLTLVLSIMSFAAGCGGSSATFEPVWYDTNNVKISRALSGDKVEGCDRFIFKRSTSDFGLYRVRCEAAGKNRVSYDVWTTTDEVDGPFAPDPALN
jgi:hypothetical protein